MVKVNKSGRIQWSKEEHKSLISFSEENPDPSLSERLKLADSLGVHVKKVTNWLRGRRTKMKRGLKVPNLLKRKQKSTINRKEDSNKTSGVKTQILKDKSEDGEDGILVTVKKSSKTHKSSKNSCPRSTEFVAHNDSLKSNTDANFLDRSDCKDINDDSLTNYRQGLLEKISPLPQVETEQVVDFRNIESLISKRSNVDAGDSRSVYLEPIWLASNFYSKNLVVENDDLEEIFDLHVDMITENNFDDNNDDLNAYEPVKETVSNYP